MWRLPLALLLVGSAVFVCAQTKQPSAEQIARRVDDHYNHLRSLRADFTEQYTGMGMERDESGTLLLARPGRMKWVYREPSGKYFLLDGRYAYFYAPGNEQVQRMRASQLDDLRSPLRFLLGHTKIASELTSLSVTDSGAKYTLTGVPRGAAKRIASVALTVTENGTITAMLIREQDGSVTRFTLGGEEDDPALAPDTFRFVPPAGVPVSDALPPA
jgi:outer membrane lipoprotein carrier protein